MSDQDRIEAALAVAPGTWRTGADWYAREVRDATGSGVAWLGGGTDREAHALAKAIASLPAIVAELRAARAEIERLRTAAVDGDHVWSTLRHERADVVAFVRGLSCPDPRATFAVAVRTIADAIESGAHVGAAKGVERG